jgi:hypothetical protein
MRLSTIPRSFVLPAVFAGLAAGASPAVDHPGYVNLTRKTYVPGSWTKSSYQNAWKQWPGVRTKPADYDRAFREYYGLPEAPFENNGLPMGLKQTASFLGRTLTVDCLVCHGGSALGTSYIGLGNTSIDIQALFEDLTAADGLPGKMPFEFTRVRGTTEAGAMAVYLLGRRNPDLTLRAKPVDLGLHDDLCEDPPAWWLLKKKRTMYWTGGADQRSVRSIMQFMMSPLTPARAFHQAEADFVQIRDYLLTLEPPKYPFPIDRELAAAGRSLFVQHCSRCHGTYGPDGKYPNKIIPIDEIGTDRRRFDGITEAFGLYYDQTWFAREHRGWLQDGYPARASEGYQAPPLDGIWATAPYFHNGSVPTLEGVLDSKARPARFTRSFRTNAEDYDSVRVGWRVREVGPADPGLPAIERRKIYDTALPGRGNSGHRYGDCLTRPERMAIIEYMKTL